MSIPTYVQFDTATKSFNYAGMTLAEASATAKHMMSALSADLGMKVVKQKAKDSLPSVNSIKNPAIIVAESDGKLAGRILITAYENGKEVARGKSYSVEQIKAAWDNFVAEKVLDKSADGALVFYACDEKRKISNHALAAAHIKGYC